MESVFLQCCHVKTEKHCLSDCQVKKERGKERGQSGGQETGHWSNLVRNIQIMMTTEVGEQQAKRKKACMCLFQLMSRSRFSWNSPKSSSNSVSHCQSKKNLKAPCILPPLSSVRAAVSTLFAHPYLTSGQVYWFAVKCGLKVAHFRWKYRAMFKYWNQ